MEESPKAEAQFTLPEHVEAFRTEGVYQRLHLCDYLRELPETPSDDEPGNR